METQASSPGSLDPQAVALAKAIRQNESGGKPDMPGKSGEYGAYQFIQPTWEKYSKEAGVNVPLKQSTLEQQNQVAYTKIKQWKDAGYNPGQIASMWNAGEGKPNAYQENYKGTNSQGVAYDTPTYAKNVATLYQKYKGEGQQANGYGGAQVAHATGAGETPSATPEVPFANKVANALGFGGSVNVLGDYIAKLQNINNPDVRDRIEQPTAGQTIGAGLQIGSLAFPYGRVAGVAEGMLGNVIGGTAAKIGGGIAAGAAGGYTQDVAQGLLDKKSLGDTLTPGTGTVVGGALGGASSALGEYLNPVNKQQKALSSVQSNIEEVVNGTKSGRQWLATERAAGNDPIGDLVKAGFVPDVQDGKLVLQDLYGSDRQSIVKRLANLRADALDATGQNATLETLYQGATNPQDASIASRIKAGGNQSKMAEEITRIMEEYKKQYGDTLSMAHLEDIKEVNASMSRRMSTSDPALSDARKQIALAAQKLIESRAEESGLPGVSELNKEIKKYHVTMPATFKKLEGATIKNGRIGNMLKQHTAGIVGGVAGTAMGGGGIGTIIGAVTAEKVMGLINRIIGDNSIADPVKEKILQSIAQREPEVVQQFLEYVGKQGAEVAPQLAPQALPQKPLGGMLGQFLTNLGSRSAAQ